MKWTKSENGLVFVCHGEKFTYAYYKDKIKCKLLVESIAVPPTKSIAYTMEVYDVKTAKQIAEALER